MAIGGRAAALFQQISGHGILDPSVEVDLHRIIASDSKPQQSDSTSMPAEDEGKRSQSPSSDSGMWKLLQQFCYHRHRFFLAHAPIAESARNYALVNPIR